MATSGPRAEGRAARRAAALSSSRLRPFDLGSRQNLSLIKEFGSKSIVQITRAYRTNKLSEQAIDCIYLGPSRRRTGNVSGQPLTWSAARTPRLSSSSFRDLARNFHCNRPLLRCRHLRESGR